MSNEQIRYTSVAEALRAAFNETQENADAEKQAVDTNNTNLNLNEVA